jgi:hypothetical protein
MQAGGKKVLKPEKTKFRQDDEYNFVNLKKKTKKKDKSVYRLLRQEKDYVV